MHIRRTPALATHRLLDLRWQASAFFSSQRVGVHRCPQLAVFLVCCSRPLLSSSRTVCAHQLPQLINFLMCSNMPLLSSSRTVRAHRRPQIVDFMMCGSSPLMSSSLAVGAHRRPQLAEARTGTHYLPFSWCTVTVLCCLLNAQ
jgi:hypothetical protein